MEALRRDPNDIRCNNAMGLWYIRKGRFDLAVPYLQTALKAQKKRNPNPYDGEPAYNLGIALKFLGKNEEAYTMKLLMKLISHFSGIGIILKPAL